jgi:hypothetical protein
LIQPTRKGVIFSGTQRDLELLHLKYDRDHYVILPQLYDTVLLEEIMRRVDSAQFLPRDHGAIGREFCMNDRITESMMTFFPNNPVFLRLLECITGEPRLGEFVGRVYRMTSSYGHFDAWHDDCCNQRVVTMSVNLSRQVYAGGVLQMKLLDSDEIIQEVHNPGFGDALLFRISTELKHRVQEVKGDVPKTAFAGWFLDVEDFLPNLHKLSNRPARSLTRSHLINASGGLQPTQAEPSRGNSLGSTPSE